MDIFQIIQLAIILMISIGMHEYAHAITSYKLGDPTPKIQGRLTPNPLKHIDPIGFLMIFLIHFGWGKPVQINPNYYKKPLQGELITSLAGPATNLFLALCGVLITLIYGKITGLGLSDMTFFRGNIVVNFWVLFSLINVALAIFNLIPIPPLDGFRLVKIINHSWARKIEKYQMYIAIGFLIIILMPGINFIGNFIFGTSQQIIGFLFGFLGPIFF